MTRSLRRFLQEPAARGDGAAERCELCATPVPAEHPHLVQVDERRMLCACGPCGLLFSEPGARLRYRRIPDRYLADPAFTLSDAQWDELQIPVGMAFFLRNTARGSTEAEAEGASQRAPASEERTEAGSRPFGTVIACYPSPAGATESELELDAWENGVGASALAAGLEPDVEALLVRRGDAGRGGAAGTECLLVPIDACYRLVGLVRLHWRGFDGGTEAWAAIDGFFDELRDRARPVRAAS